MKLKDDAIIRIPGSKSITNRALLLAALAEGTSILSNALFSDDTLTLITALRCLGVKIEVDKQRHKMIVIGCSGKFPTINAKIACQDAGTVARFLLAACANQKGMFEFDGSSRLRARPLSDLIAVLQSQGAKVSSNALPLMIENTQALLGGNIFISGDISSQYLSALLMISPYFQTDTFLQTAELISEPYVDMTSCMMRDFGVEVIRDGKMWKIKSEQHYHARNYNIESDFSSASYFFAAAAVTGRKITVKNMSRKNSIQGDKKFLDVLEQMGCIVEEENENVSVTGPIQLKNITVDMQHFSDTMMTLAAIAPFADGPTAIVNIGNTRVKESDRISAITYNLRALGLRVDEEKTALIIYPGTPTAGIIKSYADHRIAMACALIGLKVPGVIIDDKSCVSKTFPNFFEMFNLL